MRRVIMLAAVGGLALPAQALAAWQYRGRVADGHRTPFELVVRHVGPKPRLIIYAATGQLHLRCDDGTQRYRWTLGPEFPFRLLPDGRFGVTSLDVSSGPGGFHRAVHSVFDGRIRRDRAAGILHVQTRTRPHGRCDSGRLGWHARFVPRA